MNRWNLIKISVRFVQHWLSARQFLILASVAVGFAAGGMAIVLKILVERLHHIATYNWDHINEQPWLLFMPLLGIGFCVLFVQLALKGDLGKGVSGILIEIAQRSSFVAAHKQYSHVVTSALTVGLGGSAGLEAPIVITGAAVGSNLARSWELSYKERTLLLGCGAAAGIAAVFNSPIAGVMFAIEVLLAEVSSAAFIPLIIASACGALFNHIMLSEDNLFFFSLKRPFDYHNIPFYVMLAFFTAGISLYYARATHTVEQLFAKFGKHIWLKAIVGGLILAGLVLVFPSLYGEGYGSIKLLAAGKPEALLDRSLFAGFRDWPWAVPVFIGAIVLTKAVATATTLSSGGNGGNFAPSLFVGAYMGFLFARIVNLMGIADLPESNFTIVGMAGVLSGVMYAPLTGIFLIAEITGGYELMIPLMIVSTLSHVVVRSVQPQSLEMEKLVKSGAIFSQDRDQNVLMMLKTTELVERDSLTIAPNAPLGDLISLMMSTGRNIVAVVGKNGRFLGFVTLDEIREVMLQKSLYATISVRQFMRPAPITLHEEEPMLTVMKKFDETKSWYLPVLQNNVFIGFLSKAAILARYREELINASAE